MPASNTAYAMGTPFPALPKLLFIMLTEICGIAEQYDIDRESMMRRCGMDRGELEGAVAYLEKMRVLEVLGDLPGGTGWKIAFTYPGEYGR